MNGKQATFLLFFISTFILSSIPMLIIHELGHAIFAMITGANWNLSLIKDGRFLSLELLINTPFLIYNAITMLFIPQLSIPMHAETVAQTSVANLPHKFFGLVAIGGLVAQIFVVIVSVEVPKLFEYNPIVSGISMGFGATAAIFTWTVIGDLSMIMPVCYSLVVILGMFFILSWITLSEACVVYDNLR